MGERATPAWRWGLGLLLSWSFALRVWYASAGLDANRFWDERYGLANVASFLDGGSLWPVNAYHPTLSWIPQALLLGLVQTLERWTEWSALALRHPGGGFTPLAYFLCRLLQAAFGTLSIAATAHLGRRLFDSTAGLLAALLLAISPWHVRQSGVFKPDILLLLLLVVAFAASVTAVRTPSRGRDLKAGVWIGLAGAAKYNAAPIALPLVVGHLLAGRGRPWRALGAIGIAGAAALAVFLVLDPHLIAQREMLERDFGFTLRDYRKKANLQGGGPLSMAWHAVTTLLSAPFHGPLVGAAALLGLVWLAVRWWRTGRPVELVMLLSFPLGYVATYAVVTRNLSPHNWLPLLPFTALAAAAALTAGARAAAAWRPALRRAAVPAASVLVAWAAVDCTTRVYREAVPSTWERADTQLALLYTALGGPPPSLVVQQDLGAFRLGRWTSARERPLLVPASLLRRVVPAVDGRTADVEVYVAGSERRRSRAEHGGMFAIEPYFLWAHGPGLVGYVHPWTVRGAPEALTRATRGSGFELPAATGGELVSFTVVVEGTTREPGLVVRWGTSEVPLVWSRSMARRSRFISVRVPAPAGASTVLVEGIPASRVRSVVAQRWQR